MNLVELVKGQLGNQVVGQISHLIGEDISKTEAAITAAIPSLLTNISTKAESSEGMIGLSSILGKLNDNAVASIPGLLASGKAESLATQGSSMLASLLGKDQLLNLSGGLAVDSGISETASQKLLGVLGPIAIGTMKKNLLSAGGISSENISNLLLGQPELDIAQAQEPFQIAAEPFSRSMPEDVEVTEIAEPLKPDLSVNMPRNPIRDALDQADNLAPTVTEAFSGAKDDLADGLDQANEELSAQADRFLDTEQEAMQAVEARASQAAQGLTSHVTEGQNHVQSIGQKSIEAIDDVAKAAKNTAGDALDSFSENTDDFKEFATQSMGQAKDVGKNAMVAGQDFAEATASKISDTAGDVANKAKEAAKGAGSLGSGLTRFLLPVLIVAIVIFLILNLFK